MIAVIGHLDVASHDRDQLVESSTVAVRLARATDGCLHFAVTADGVDPARVNVAELWSSRESLETFRGAGVDEQTGAAIRAFHIQEYAIPGPA